MRAPKPYLHVAVLTILVVTGCGPENGDKITGLPSVPANAKVTLRTYHPKAATELPEALRSRFILMVRQDATYVDFSGATAAPLAEFEASGLVFYWHGNSVVHGNERKGKAWTSPLMQALINHAGPVPQSAEEWQELLKNIAADSKETLNKAKFSNFGLC